jgi:pyridoxal phosphate enzyme (YggS family)
MSKATETIATKLAAIEERIQRACQRVHRTAREVTLVCVSKTVEAAIIESAYQAGARIFGENYGQHLRDKSLLLAELSDLRWHFIGRLQRNKVKYAVGISSLIHTVDNPALIEAIDRQARSRDCVQKVLVQLNLSGEASKSGCAEPELGELLTHFGSRRHTRCVGLMTMPPYAPDPESSRELFARLRQIRDRFREQDPIPNVDLRHLSMGMSGDFEVAIEEGATLVRVGSAIFGPRDR